MTSDPAAANEPLLLRQDRDGIATLILNRPQARNAISIALMEELSGALAALARDPAVKVVILAAAGPAFCAGHDLKELRSLPRREAYESVFRHCSEVMLAILRLPKPVVARVQGIATAAGCQLVASCDLAVAAEGARFATPGVNIGLFCSTPMVALSRAVPRKQAMEMLLTGEAITAERARALGLVNQVVPAHELENATWALAKKIAGKSPLIVKIGKKAFYRQAEMDVAAAYAYTSQVMTENMLARDAAEGIDAFIEKREPHWQGC
ncbi:MAG TPA: enoyl-CoA hydratase [Dongiaceae bacterium]|nr:enoyl-CoA hydratase [Dongiaceae bacterium]